MPEIIAQFLDSFERLSIAEQRLAAVEIWKRVKEREAEAVEGPITDEDLAQMGDELFQMYDREEARNGTAETW